MQSICLLPVAMATMSKHSMASTNVRLPQMVILISCGKVTSTSALLGLTQYVVSCAHGVVILECIFLNLFIYLFFVLFPPPMDFSEWKLNSGAVNHLPIGCQLCFNNLLNRLDIFKTDIISSRPYEFKCILHRHFFYIS